MLQGTVVEYHREYCWVQLDGSAREVIAKPRSRLEIEAQREEIDSAKEGRPVFHNQVAAGDRVDLSEAGENQFVIEGVAERETWLMRRGPERAGQHRMQLIVANADQLAVVVAPNPDLRLNVVDRYLLAAIQGGLAPLLVVNKIDLDPAVRDSTDVHDYQKLGYTVLFTSATEGEGLAQLAALLQDKFTAFCGHSGVGKSTILRELTGHEIEVGEVKEASLKGRHTTTTSRVYPLPGGGMVVDTPGIRTFGLAHLDWLDVHEYFSDIAELTSACSFRDCSHTVEPGCKVREAVEAGELSSRRLESYQKLRKESEKSRAYWQ